jgi:alcohol dehydrogenase class IV
MAKESLSILDTNDMVPTSFCSVQIKFVSKSDLLEQLLCLDAKRVALFMSERAALRWGLQTMVKLLEKQYELKWINHCPANFTQNDICLALRNMSGFWPDYAIAIGGGSVIDLAKAVNAFWDENNSDKTSEEIDRGLAEMGYRHKTRFFNIIAVPTTAGSGSELTPWGTVWDVGKKRKYSVESPLLKPKIALLCPELTLTMPARLTLATALDSMAHALEAFWSKRSNPLVRELAKQSAYLVVNYLKPTLRDLNNIENRQHLSLAALLSALAFSQTKTTASHSISYPLTMFFNIEHGFAVAITLPEIYEINRTAVNISDLDTIFAPLGIRAWLDDVSTEIITLRLSYFGVEADDIGLIVENAFTAGRMDNNPVELSRAMVGDLLVRVLN